MTQIPRPEHPQPQMKREHWKNLNGEWDFSFDFGCSGIDQKWQEVLITDEAENII